MRIPTRVAAGMASAAVLVGGAVTMAPAASAAQTSCIPNDFYQINTDGVNFRTQPGTGYKSRGLLYRGDWGWKIGAKGSWVKLRLGAKSHTGLPKNSTGWVAKRYAQDCL